MAGEPVRAGPGDGELDPVLDRRVLGLAGAPDVAALDVVADQLVPVGGDDSDRAVGGHLEGLVVRAVLLGGLGHQADVGHRAHGRRVEGAVGAAVVDRGLEDAGVGRVRDHREGVGLLAVRAPHVATGADHGGHAGVDDDVGGHVQVGDALVRVDHGQRRAVGEALLDGGLDRGAVLEPVEAREDAAEAVVGRQAGGRQLVAVLLEDLRQERAHDVAEDDRVGDLHHRGLEVHREEHVVGLGTLDLRLQELVERVDAQDGGVDDLTGQDLEVVLEHGDGAVGGGVLDAQGVVGGEDDGLLVVAEVVGVHGRDVGPRVRAPGAHRVRVRPRVVLDRAGRATIGVALTQDRVDRGALDLVVLRAGRLVLVGLRVLGVVRQVVALVLQLLDRGLQLRDGGGDVGELDDVGLGPGGQLAELGERVVDALLLGEALGELADDPAGERDVAGLDLDAGGLGVGRDDRQERVRRQHGCFIGVGVDDLGHEYEALLGTRLGRRVKLT